MKFHVNSPTYPKGFELEVAGVGLVQNGDVLELNDIQIAAFEANGVEIPKDKDMYLYNEAPVTKAEKVDPLRGIEEIAEDERAKSAPKIASKKEEVKS